MSPRRPRRTPTLATLAAQIAQLREDVDCQVVKVDVVAKRVYLLEPIVEGLKQTPRATRPRITPR